MDQEPNVQYLFTSHDSWISSDSPIATKLLSRYNQVGFKAVQDLFSSFRCNICTKLFNSNKELKIHKISEHERNCQFCTKKFPTNSQLRRHERIHTREKPFIFKCLTCSKGFTNYSRLKVHQLVHTSKKPYQCSICEKSYITKGSLKVHEEIHFAEKYLSLKNNKFEEK